MDEILKADANFRRVVGGITNNSDQDITIFRTNPTTKRLLVEQSALGYTLDSVFAVEGWYIPQYDYIHLTYTGNNLTQVLYKSGGTPGTSVGTLTLGYATGTLTSITLAT